MKKTIFKYGFFSARLGITAFFVNLVLNCGCDTCSPSRPDDSKDFEIYYDALPLGGSDAVIYGVNHSKPGFGWIGNGMLFSAPNSDGIIAYTSQKGGLADALMYYSLGGGKSGKIVDKSAYPGISFVIASPGSRKVLFADGSDLYFFNMDGTGDYQLTSGLCPGTLPSFSPDGKYIAFFTGTSTDSAMKLLAYYSDNPAGNPALSADLPFGAGKFHKYIGITWSPDSKSVVYTRSSGGISKDLIFKEIISGSENIAGDDNFGASQPVISPGLDTFCFACSDGNIRIKRISDGKIWRITAAEAGEYYSGPQWSPDGEKILFIRFRENISGGGTLEVFGLKTGKTIIIGNNILRAFWNRQYNK